MDCLRDQYYTGWTPSAELQERLNDLNERDAIYAAEHMDVARAFLDAAERDVNATRQVRTERREKLIAAIPVLKRAWEKGWETADKWTDEERVGIKWLIYCNPNLNSMRWIAEQSTIYFCQKLARYRKAAAADDYNRAYGLRQNPKIKLGLNLLGKKGFGK